MTSLIFFTRRPEVVILAELLVQLLFFRRSGGGGTRRWAIGVGDSCSKTKGCQRYHLYFILSLTYENEVSASPSLFFLLSSRQSLTPSTASANTQRRPRSHRRRSSWSSCVGCSSTATRRRCHCPVCCLPPTSRLRHKQPPLPPHSPAATLLYPEDTLCLCHSLLHCQPVRLPQQWLPQVFS